MQFFESVPARKIARGGCIGELLRKLLVVAPLELRHIAQQHEASQVPRIARQDRAAQPLRNREFTPAVMGHSCRVNIINFFGL
jgi:hypothetical protein